MLSTGAMPSVEVRRPAPSEPQAPDDASFFATEVRLDRNPDAPKLELNIDNDNLTLPQAAPPDAVLRVLGLDIEITVGLTEIETQEAGQDDDDQDQDDDQDDGQDDDDDDDQADAVEFEDQVVSADVSGGRFTLEDGTIVSMDANTVVDPDGDLTTLADVEAALAAGRAVRAEGDGFVLVPGPPTEIAASDVKFEVDEDDDDDDADDDDGNDDDANEPDFEARVKAVDLAAGTLTLEDGTVVRITADTEIKDGDFRTLAEVQAVLAAGVVVVADGEGTLTAEGPPRMVEATKVEFERED